MLFGLLNSFILLFSLLGFASFSGTGGGALSGTVEGEYCCVRGYTAAWAAVAAAKLWPPRNPSMVRRFWPVGMVLKLRSFCIGYLALFCGIGGCAFPPGGTGGSGSVCERLRLCCEV